MPLVKTTDFVSIVHSPVDELQSSLSSGISRVSSICLVIDTTSSRGEPIIKGLGSGLTGFGLLNCICARAVIPVNNIARRTLERDGITRSDINLILLLNVD